MKKEYIIKLGQDMIDQLEYHGLFSEDDKKWNDSVVLGNKLVSVGTTWRLQSINDLSQNEKDIVMEYLEMRRLERQINEELSL